MLNYYQALTHKFDNCEVCENWKSGIQINGFKDK